MSFVNPSPSLAVTAILLGTIKVEEGGDVPLREGNERGAEPVATSGAPEIIANPASAIAEPESPLGAIEFPALSDSFRAVITSPNFPSFAVSQPKFESSYKGLIDGINDLSGQIDAKKAELSNPDLDPSKRMELSIEMQELMQMRLQMITITTNLLKTDHDSAQAVNNNLRV